MKKLFAILLRATRSFKGSLLLRFLVVISIAIVTGATAGVLPAVIGQALSAISPSAAPGRPPQGFAGLVGSLMPSGATWAVVLVTLVATMLTVGLSVMSSKLGSTLSGDVTAAVRIQLMQAVLGASARDVAAAGQDLTTPRLPGAPPGKAPPGKAAPPAGPPGKAAPPPGKAAPPAGPPGKAAPPGAPPGKAAPPGAPPGKAPPPGAGVGPAEQGAGARDAIVKLAVSREAALVSDFGVSVLTGLPQSLATLAILGFELMTSDAWVVLAGGCSLFILSRLFADRASKRVAAERRNLQTADAAVFGSLQDTLSATEDLRLWGARREAVADFARVAYECATARSRFAGALAVSGQIKSVFMAMSPLLIVVALKFAGQGYDAGEVAKLLLLVPLLMARLEALDGIRQGLIEREPLLEVTTKLLELPEAPPRAADARQIDPAALAGRISFKSVSFTPPDARSPILDEVTLDIPAGSVIGVCGPSGSGKSSLVRLLLRLDDPTAGSIELDGLDLSQIEPQQLPQIFGVVRQTSALMQRPIRSNLGLGLEPKPSDEQMRQALEQVKLTELSAAGDGAEDRRSLATEYRANPPNFSGGECRRLLLARMLLGPARVLVLDEPEAGLPSGTAEEILRTVVELADGRTHVVVTHAPHLLGSDFNVVLDQGRIVAMGPHDELVEHSEVYRELLADALKGSS